MYFWLTFIDFLGVDSILSQIIQLYVICITIYIIDSISDNGFFGLEILTSVEKRLFNEHYNSFISLYDSQATPNKNNSLHIHKQSKHHVKSTTITHKELNLTSEVTLPLTTADLFHKNDTKPHYNLILILTADGTVRTELLPHS